MSNRKSSASAGRSCETTDFTTVEILWREKRIENRIRFGHPVQEKIIDRHRRVLSFAPRSILAFVRWTSNDFGTMLSRIPPSVEPIFFWARHPLGRRRSRPSASRARAAFRAPHR
jgi:hypothetical protein